MNKFVQIAKGVGAVFYLLALLVAFAGLSTFVLLADSAHSAHASDQSYSSGRIVAQGASGEGSVRRTNPPSATVARGSGLSHLLDAVVIIVAPTKTTDYVSLGSGFFVDPLGTLITNQHVVGTATTIAVGLRDGRVLSGRVIASNSSFDLALVSVSVPSPSWLPLMRNLDSSTTGENVIAIGTPSGKFGSLPWSVTKGIVSSIRDGEGGVRLVQTDASINSGNSGGPLVLTDCNAVAGVVTFRFAQGSTGLGFAVAADAVYRAFAEYLPSPTIECGANRAALVDKANPKTERSISTRPLDSTAPSARNLAATTARPLTGTVLARTSGPGRGELIVRNELFQDALVVLRAVEGSKNGEIVIYVRGRDYATILDVATGEYDLHYTFGSGWTGRTFSTSEGTYKLKQSLTFEGTPVVIRGAQGTRRDTTTGDGWTVILKSDAPSTPAQGPPRRSPR